MNSNEILLYLSLKYEGNWEKIYQAITEREEIDEKQACEVIKNVNSKYITILSEEYPDNLKRIFRPPFVLYYHGDISLLKDSTYCLAVVGSREYSRYGEQVTKKLVKDLAKELIIVSGLARGIDAIAHHAAIESGGRTIAVLGNGINVCYLKQNQDLYDECKKNHLIISEYPDQTSPRPGLFPIRNRIIVGISNVVLVTEGKINSGTQITAALMAEKNGNVCCVPARYGENSICNHMIASGAYLVESVYDIFEVAGIIPKTLVFGEKNLKE